MIEIAKAIQEGAQAYLVRQFRAIGDHRGPAGRPGLRHRHQGDDLPTASTTVLSFAPSGLFRAIAFLVGAALSGLAGFIGMSTAVRGNVRTAAAAQ